MANRPNQKRNDQIVRLHDLDPIKYSFANLARKFKIAKSTVHEIYVREKAKMGDKKALSSWVVKSKYPSLA
jgi:hypothetical protein